MTRPNRLLRWRDGLTAAAMVAVMTLQIVTRLTDAAWPDRLSWVALAAILALAGRRIGRRELYLLSMCALAALAIFAFRPDPVRVLAAALSQAAFLMAFILHLGLLYEAAVTSRSITELGPYLTGQPPGRRYSALYTGTGVLALLFNAGILSFLVPLVQGGRQREAGAARAAPEAERRQINALMRGFAWSIAWSPTALAPLLMAELVPAIDRSIWMVYGLFIFAVVLWLGLREDRRRPAPQRAPQTLPMPRRAVAGLAGASTALLLISVAAIQVSGQGLAFGLMVACPAMLVGWTLVQSRALPAPLTTGAARLGQVLRDLPAATPVAVTMACAGFLGLSTAALIPPDSLERLLNLHAVPDLVILLVAPLILALISLTGLTPIMMSVFLGNLLAGMTDPPVDLTLLALAISCGWAISMTFSPLSTLALLVGRLGSIAPVTLTWRWNLRFSLLVYLALIPLLGLVSWLHTGVFGF